MPATDLPLLIEAAREAGKIATGFTGKTAKRWDKPDGAGPVTEADLAVNNMLEQQLLQARPDYGWLSEETADNADRLGRDRVFIIDPIDGTRSFIEGAKTWAHALAVAEKGVVTAAVIYLPLCDLMYVAAAGQGAFLNDVPISPGKAATLADADILAARPNLDPSHWKNGEVPDFKCSYRPSLAYRMALVAQGRFDGMLTLRPSWEWDIAAGDLITREAGALCSDRHAAPLRFNNPVPQLNGVVSASPVLHGQISKALSSENTW